MHLAPLGLLALGVAWRAGVFRRGSIVGPTRVDERESLVTPFLLFVATAFLFLFVPAVVF